MGEPDALKSSRTHTNGIILGPVHGPHFQESSPGSVLLLLASTVFFVCVCVESHDFELLGTQKKFKPLGQPMTFRLDYMCVLALVSLGTDTHCLGSIAPEGGGVGSKGSLCALPTLSKALGSHPHCLLGIIYLLQGLLTPAQQ